MSRNFFLKGIASILFVSAILVSTANAQSGKRIIVDKTSTTNSGLSFSTIKMAVDSAVSGDTIIISEGVYKEKLRITKQGLTIASNFLLDKDTTHISRTIISGDSVTQQSQFDALIYFNGSGQFDTTQLKVIGLTLTKASRYVLNMRLGLVSDCILANNGVNYSFPFMFEKTVIRNSKIENNKGQAIFFFQGDWGNPQYTTVENCLFLNNYSFWQNLSSGNQEPVGINGNGGAVIYLNNSTKLNLTNNIFYKNNGENLINISSGGQRDTINIVNNTMFMNKNRAMYNRSWEGDVNNTYFVTRIQNNIIYNDFVVDNYNSEFWWGAGSNSKPGRMILNNNIIHGGFNPDPKYGYGPLIEIQFDTASHMDVMPSFSDTANLKFDLTSTSAGIGAGLSNSFVPNKDIFGVDRPNPSGSKPELGAVETSTALPKPILTSLQNTVIGGNQRINIGYSILSNPKIDSVVIYRSTTSGTSSMTAVNTIYNDPTLKSIYTDISSMTASTTYYYAIKTAIKGATASSTSTYSDFSEVKSIKTPATSSAVQKPTNFSLAISGRSGVSLSWSIPSSNGSTKIIIYRGTSASKMDSLTEIKDTASIYNDLTTYQQTKYYYYLLNKDNNGVVSEASDTKDFTTPGPTPIRWYVRSAATGSEGGRDSVNAYKTISKAFSQAIKGDTIIILRGTYNEKISMTPGLVVGSNYLLDPTDTGAISNTIISATGLRGNIITYSNSSWSGPSIRNYFIGLSFKNVSSKVAKLASFQWGGPAAFTFDKCIFSNNGEKDITGDNNTDFEQNTRFLILGDSAIIKNSIFENNYARLRFEGNNPQLINNIFRNNNLNMTRPDNYWINVGLIDGWTNGKADITGNIFINNGTLENYDANSSNRDRQHYILKMSGNDSVFISNNTFYNSKVTNIVLENQTPVTYYVNNIFYKNYKDFFVASWANTFSDVYFLNNYFTNDISKTNTFDKLSPVFTNNIIAPDPMFADTLNLNLKSSSLLINSGVNSFAKSNNRKVRSKDLYGTDRPSPSTTNSDIGAVENIYGFSAPTLMSLDGGDKKIIIKWSKPLNGSIAGYDIYRSTSDIAESNNTITAFTTITNADTLSYIDTALTNLTKYYYRIKAFTANKASYSGFSNQLSAKPNTPPTKLDTLSAYGGARSVIVQWKDTSKRMYNVYRGVNANNLDKIASNIDTTIYVDNSAFANVKYFYGIKVVDSVGAASDISKLAFATASNIWIIDTAGKSTGNGSEKYPLKSIQYAIDNSISGDTILLNNGTYVEDLQIFSKTVVLKARNLGKAIINPLSPSSKPILNIQDQNQWGQSIYSKPQNKIIGLVFSGSTYTNWSNMPPAAININFNSNPIFESCTFTNNSSQYVFNIDQSAPLFNNSLIINNTTQNGIFNIQYADTNQVKTKVPKFVNSIFVNNSSFNNNCCGAERGVVIFNSIITENGYNNNFNEKLFRVENSIVDNPKFVAQSSTNQVIDPQFNNSAAFDYTLSSNSPALGKGSAQLILKGANTSDTLNALAYDYNYNDRPNPAGTKNDLGAFESKYSVAAPQISRLQKSAKNITLTWENPVTSNTYTSVQVYRDTVRTSLDTIAPLSNITVDVTKNTISDVLPSDKEYFYALKATIGSGNAAVKTGLSNIKSSLDTVYVPALSFALDTASFKVRSGSRNSNHVASAMNLINISADRTPTLPKLILYSQEFKSVDSTRGGVASDSMSVLNITKVSANSTNIKFSLNKVTNLAKGKADYMQILNPMNVNGDDDVDFVTIFRKNGNQQNNTQLAYLVNNNSLTFNIDTTNAPRNFMDMNNTWGVQTNFTYKWNQKTFPYYEWNTSVGQSIESAAEYMDGNFDGKEELIASMHQVKWEPNASINFTNTSLQNVNSALKLVKFVDVNNDGIPDIFGMTNWGGAIGLGQTNGNPLVVFVSNKKDGKFYMYNTGLNVDWSANLFIGDFNSNRKVQIFTRVNGGSYRLYDLDATFSAANGNMQFTGSVNDGKVTIGDINNDGFQDIITVDNSNTIYAYINNHLNGFVKKSIGAIPFNSNSTWSLFNLRLMDLNNDGFKDLLWMENQPEADGSVNWNSNNFVVKSWLQTAGTDEFKPTAPAAVSSSDIKVSNNGYKVKIKWTPSKDKIDPYLFANLKVDTLDTYKNAFINNAYNYRASDPTIPIIVDRAVARNYPDSLEFSDINISSKKPYYISLQMVNKFGQASNFSTKVFSPTDPLQSVDNPIPGLYNARFTWGDYNNDGLLDLAVMGQSDNGNVTKIYQNNGGTFTDLNLTNKSFRYGDIKWVDINNDGWLDLAIIGQSASAVSFQLLINNQGVFEVNTPSSVAGLKYSNIAFGDYDNNGTLDMFTAGQDLTNNARSYIYKNDGKGNFTIDPEFNQYNVVPNLYNADARFVDYDLDGDLDLIYAGTDNNNNPQGGIRVNTILDPKVTTNNYGGNSYNNGYTYNMNMSMKDAKFDVGDLDGDGDIDIAAIGTGRQYNGNSFIDFPQLLLVRNQTIESKNAKFGNYFSYGSIYNTQTTILDSIEKGDVKLVDFNNDGLLDITVAGLDAKANPVSKFYLNQGGFGNFTLAKIAGVPQLSNSAISWGDANGDGSMDLVLSGNKAVGSSTGIYLNNQGENGNKAPSQPSNLRFIDQGQGRILLQWDAAKDDLTKSSNLYYNLKLGTKPGASDLRVVQVNPKTDQLLTPNTSLIGSNQYYMELPPGVYYWSVQAVDGNYTSSKFAESQTIVLKYPWQFLNQGGIVDTRIQPLEKPAFAWADANNTGKFDFLYLGHVTNNGSDYGNPNTPVGLYKNVGGKFYKLPNDSTRSSLAGTGTGFGDAFAGIVNAEIKWVDINNDNYLDLAVAGSDFNNGSGRLKIFKNKGNYKFEEITGAIYNQTPLSSPKIAFVDLDNDGYKDMIYTGLDAQANGVFKFISIQKDTASSNRAGVKATALTNNLDAVLTSKGISNVILSLGDINKDLKTDLVIMYDDDGNNSRRVGEVYMNTTDTTNKTITFARNTSLSLPTLVNATIDLVDYNNDGLLDLAVSGTSQATGQVFRIYQNKWADSAAKTIQFLQTNSDVKPFESGQTTWGDINADGYPDVIFSGTRTGVGAISSMALANNNTSNGIIKYGELPTFPFGNYTVMRPSLGDFSGKKVPDLVLVGTEKVVNPTDGTSTLVSSFKILKNVRDLSAKVVAPAAASTNSMETVAIKSMSSNSTSKLAAFSQNPYKGFATTDTTIAVVDSNYVESSYVSNAAPSQPTLDNSNIISKVDDRYLVQLNWKPSKDDNTPSSGLTYAVAIGTAPGKIDVMDPNADIATGTRKTPDAGNAGKNNSMTVLLAPGTYYWTVQSIDAANAGSNFGGTKTIQVTATRSLVERSAPYNILLNNSTDTSFYLKQNDSTGVKYKITAYHADSTAKLKYSIVSDATFVSDTALFRLDTINNLLQLKALPTKSSYALKLRVTDNYGGYFDKAYSFKVITAPTNILVNEKDTSLLYYTKANADSAKFTITLRGNYTTPPTSFTPVLTYGKATGANSDNNDLFDLVNSVLINKRKLDDADTIRLKVNVTDQYGLSVERVIKLINLDCTTKPSFTFKSSAVACLPNTVNLTDTAFISNASTALTYTYFSDINTTNKVAQPSSLGTSGTYYVKGTTAAGCAVVRSISVTVAAKPANPVVSAAAVCQNDKPTIAYTAPNANTKLVWYGNNATGGTGSTITPTFNTSAAGTQSYYVAQADTVAGCYGDRVKLDILVKSIPVAPILSRDTAGYLVSNVSKNNTWYKDNAKVDSSGTDKFKPAVPGSYTVKVLENGCFSAMSAAYYFIVTDIINLGNNEFIKITPNPFVNYLNFDYKVAGYQYLNVEFFDMTNGQRVMIKERVLPGSILNVGSLVPGTYLIRVVSNDYKLKQQFKMIKM
mgnify:CR=1 FL=1